MKQIDLPNGISNFYTDLYCDGLLCFRAINKSTCSVIDLTDYAVTLKIYTKGSETILLGKPRIIGASQIVSFTDEYVSNDPTTGKVCFRMTKNEVRDDYCGMNEGCCYCYEAYAEKTTGDLGDRICLSKGKICINKKSCL